MRRIAAFSAVLGVMAGCLLAPAAAGARPRALIGFMPTSPAPKMPLLFDLAERDFSYGVTSPTLGAFSKRQMLLGTFARRAMQLWAATDVLVARFPNDASGLAALDGVLRDRRPNDLILIVRAPPAGRLRLLPSGMLGPGASRDVIYSPTTRRLGLV